MQTIATVRREGTWHALAIIFVLSPGNSSGDLYGLHLFNKPLPFAPHFLCFAGVSRENVRVEVDHNNVLHISANPPISESEQSGTTTQGGTFHRKERSSRSMYRAIRLPRTCDCNNVRANVQNGVLRIELDKTTHDQQRKRITVG
jgi:hypothetical protein